MAPAPDRPLDNSKPRGFLSRIAGFERQIITSSARIAYNQGHLMQHTCAIVAKGPRYQEAIQTLPHLENQWVDAFKKHKTISPEEHHQRVVKTVRNQPEWFRVHGTPEKVDAYIANIAKHSPKAIFTMSVCLQLSKFLHERGFFYRFRTSADSISVLQKTGYDCLAISTLVLHLMKKLGDEKDLIALIPLKALQIPAHVTLVLPLEDGSHIYFNDASSFFPGDQYNLKTTDPTYTRFSRGYEEFLEPWQIVSSHYVDLAGIQFRSGDVEAAKSNYRTALIIDPNCAQAYAGLADICFRQDDKEGGEALWSEALAINPHLQSQYHISRAHYFLRRGEYSEGFAEIGPALLVDPNQAEIHYLASVLHLKLGRPSSAIRAAETAFHLNPNSQIYKEQLALLIWQRDKKQLGKKG